MSHSPNCQCAPCTGGDPYIAKIRSKFGSNNATSVNRFAARVGVYGTNRFNHADPIQTVSVTHPGTTVVATEAGKNAWLKDLASQALGLIMQKQAAGESLPPAIEKIGSVANQVTGAGVQAGISKANTTVGENVIKFSPYIIGGVVLLMGSLIFLIAKKS